MCSAEVATHLGGPRRRSRARASSTIPGISCVGAHPISTPIARRYGLPLPPRTSRGCDGAASSKCRTETRTGRWTRSGRTSAVATREHPLGAALEALPVRDVELERVRDPGDDVELLARHTKATIYWASKSQHALDILRLGLCIPTIILIDLFNCPIVDGLATYLEKLEEHVSRRQIYLTNPSPYAFKDYSFLLKGNYERINLLV